MKRNLPACFAAALVATFSLLSPRLAAESLPVEPVRLRLEVDREVLPAEVRDRAIVKVGLDCARILRRELRPPVNLALVIDRSGSMAGDKIEKAREAALEAVRRLGPDDIVALVAYDTRVETLVPAQRVGNGRELERAIRGLTAGGNTALHGGVTRGAAEVRRHLEDPRLVNRVVLLSDGLANVGPHTPEELGRLGSSLLREGISVTTVGLGLGYNEDLMTRLAQRSDGNTYFVEHSGDLPRIFAAELGDVLNVVARRIVIEIEFPEGVRPLRLVGRDGTIRGQRAEITLNQLYGGQEKFALVEVEVPPSRPDVSLEIARAQVSYDDAVSQKATTLRAARTVRFSADGRRVVDSANHRVQSDYAANELALAKDQAIALVDANRRDEAASQLRARTEQLKAMGETYRNAAVSDLAGAAAPAAAKIEQQGLDNAERKLLRAESAQVRSQQNNATQR